MTEINRVQIGEKLHTYGQFNALPPGTVVGARVGDRNPYTKNPRGQWFSASNSTYAFEAEGGMPLGNMMVLSYPDGYSPEPAAPLTLLQYKWQFRDYMFAAQEMHGVSHDAVRRTIDGLGATSDLFPLGPFMVVESEHERERLPEGTVIMSGNPHDYDRSGLFIKRGGLWRTGSLGALRAPRRGYPSLIEAMPGAEVPPVWWSEVGTDADAEALLTFKRQAWTAAMKLKDSQSWCSTLESCISRVGLTPAVMTQRIVGGLTVGANVNCLEARDLPEGTVLRWRGRQDPEERVTYFIRDNSHDNQARTRRLFGYRNDNVPLTHYARVMEIMGFAPDMPGAWYSIEFDLRRALPLLEPGTLLAYDTAEPQYMITEDHRISPVYDISRGTEGVPPRRGNWDQSSFDQSQRMRVARFGRTLPARTAVAV